MKYTRYDSYKEALHDEGPIKKWCGCVYETNYVELCAAHTVLYGCGAMNWDGTITVTEGS